MNWHISVNPGYIFQELAPTEKIPDEFYELGHDPEVLSHTCPAHLNNLKDDEVSGIITGILSINKLTFTGAKHD